MATIPESFHDILLAPGTATLTTNGADGYPQSTAVWYRFDAGEGVIRIVMQATTRKARNLQRDQRCSFLLIDPADNGRAIEVRADADLAIEQGDSYPMATWVLAAYDTDMSAMGNRGAPRVVATLRPVRVNTHGG
jgi:PPOX class probable F420-dependent enzyme